VRVALVTGSRLEQEDADEAPLAEALRARGHQPGVAVWDDPALDWSVFDAALIRSTWDYFRRRDEFVAWAFRAGAATRLFNPPELVRWTTHKFYLRELERGGAPVVPTEFLEAGSRVDLAALMSARGWESVVVKPAVSADSFATLRAGRGDPAAGQAHLDRHLRERDMMVQAYMPAVAEPGERCLVAIDGRLSHAVRKRSLFLGGRHAGPEGLPVEVADDEAAAARAILALVPGGLPLYARIDLVRDPAGRPRLMELELAEPSLFFAEGPGSAARLVEALERRLAGR